MICLRTIALLPGIDTDRDRPDGGTGAPADDERGSEGRRAG
jgi:hypothetical protein